MIIVVAIIIILLILLHYYDPDVCQLLCTSLLAKHTHTHTHNPFAKSNVYWLNDWRCVRVVDEIIPHISKIAYWNPI